MLILMCLFLLHCNLKSVIFNIGLFFTDPPTVNASPHLYSIILGTNLTMNCNVSGVPAPHYVSWLRNETSGMAYIQSNGVKYDGGILTSPSLTIYNVEDTDEGWYTCFSTNLAGSNYSEPVYLNISGGNSIL